jgi:3-oxoacyl-[acyl-carrier protein] reductase
MTTVETARRHGGRPRTGRGIPLRRDRAPADIADAALFLASDMSRFMTGDSLMVDGGQMRI